MISVVVPVYNVEKYLKKCVDSILNQTYVDLEIILVDDGSTDSSPQICDEYLQKDNRVRVIHQKNSGLSAARNAGIEIAGGNYIGFIDSDDYIAVDMYEKMLNAMVESNADLVICNYMYVDEEGNTIVKESPIKDEVVTGLAGLEKLNENQWWYYTTAWNKLYKKKIFDTVRFPVGKLHEDVFTVHAIFFECQNILTLEEMLYFYVQRKGSIMAASTTIKHLDEVEGLARRCVFYVERNLSSLLPEAVMEFKKSYQRNRLKIIVGNATEKKRVKIIDQLFKETYYHLANSVTWKERIMCTFPRLYFSFQRIKCKIRFRSRIRNLRCIHK